MMHPLKPIAVLLFASACGEAEPSMPENATVLSHEQASHLANPCSRQGIRAYESIWTPRASDILDFENSLSDWLAQGKFDTRTVPQYIRQYGGFIVSGRQKIYGNFLPKSDLASLPNWQTEAVIVCDGGTSFWGASFDRSSSKIENVEFNGGAP